MRIRPILNFSHIFFENSLQFQKLCLPLQPQTRKIGAIAQLVEQRTENPCVPGSIPFFYPDGKYRIFKFLSLFRLHPVMCAKLLFHTGDWNCQTAEKQ